MFTETSHKEALPKKKKTGFWWQCNINSEFQIHLTSFKKSQTPLENDIGVTK